MIALLEIEEIAELFEKKIAPTPVNGIAVPSDPKLHIPLSPDIVIDTRHLKSDPKSGIFACRVTVIRFAAPGHEVF